MRYFIILVLIFLQGCATTPKPTAILTDKVVHIDARILEPCADLNTLPDNASFDDLLRISFSNIEIYSECKRKQNASIEVIKQFSNRK